MKCTNCNQGTLSPHLIEETFKAHTCTACGGHWILLDDYLAWKNNHSDFQFSTTTDDRIKIEETSNALLCPVNGIIMRKFRLTAQYPYRLDFSASVRGLWLDKGKWELLKKHGLANSLDKILTSQWQNRIRLELAKESFTDLYEKKFGHESYDRIRDVRDWLNNHPCKSDLRAYLLADHPYSASK